GQSWEGKPEGTTVVAFDPRLQHYVRGDPAGCLSLRRVVDDREVIRLPGPGYPAWVLRFSRDGRFLAVKYHPRHALVPITWKVWDLTRGQSVIEGSNVHEAAFDFRPDTRQAAVGLADGSVLLFDLTTGRESRRLVMVAAPEAPDVLAYSPDGRALA